MSRSIFDPSRPDPEREGTRFTPPAAGQFSSLPEVIANAPTEEPDVDVGFMTPPQPPALSITSENDAKLLVVKMTGTLQKHDYDHFIPVVNDAVARHGKVRMLVEMHNFHGWSAGAAWEDVKFDLKHFNHIERLAVIGETTWQKWATTFCKPFTTATIRYFTQDRAAEARRWIVEMA